MRAVWSVAVVAVLALVVGLHADEAKKGKEVTLKGKITCAKCDLKLEGVDACATVIQVKKGKKAEVYYFDAAAHKKYHGGICKKGKLGTVKGTVSEEDGKKVIKVTKLDYKK
jgi:hypothetical protein